MSRASAAAKQLHLAENAIAAGRFAEALELLRTAARLERDSPRPALMLAYALSQLGQTEEAIAVLRRLLERQSANSDAWFNLGNLLRKQRRFEEAVRAFRRAMLLRPENRDAAINLGYTLVQQGQFVEAEAELRAAIARFPAEPDLLINLAQMQRATQRWDEALATLERCTALAPRHAGYALTRAIVLYEAGKSELALAALDELLQEHPGMPDAHFARAQVRLSRSDWRGGWDDYLWRPERVRWLSTQGERSVVRPPPADAFADKDAIVVGEQGLGDTLFFLRFAEQLRRRARSLSFDVDKRLAALLRFDPPAKDQPLRVLAGDLPAILGGGLAPSIRLSADGSKFRERLKECGAPPYVGISWQGGVPWKDQSVPGESLFKRVPPAELGAMLAAVPGTLVSLQRAAPVGDLEALAIAAGRPVHDFSAVNQDLIEATALLAALDEYVAVSNTNVHLNEALGQRTRVLLTVPAEWRWMTEGDRPVWFPHAVLYRQQQGGSWDAALRTLREDLRK